MDHVPSEQFSSILEKISPNTKLMLQTFVFYGKAMMPITSLDVLANNKDKNYRYNVDSGQKELIGLKLAQQTTLLEENTRLLENMSKPSEALLSEFSSMPQERVEEFLEAEEVTIEDRAYLMLNRELNNFRANKDRDLVLKAKWTSPQIKLDDKFYNYIADRFNRKIK